MLFLKPEEEKKSGNKRTQIFLAPFKRPFVVVITTKPQIMLCENMWIMNKMAKKKEKCFLIVSRMDGKGWWWLLMLLMLMMVVCLNKKRGCDKSASSFCKTTSEASAASNNWIKLNKHIHKRHTKKRRRHRC